MEDGLDGNGGTRLEVCQRTIVFHTLFWDYFLPVVVGSDLNICDTWELSWFLLTVNLTKSSHMGRDAQWGMSRSGWPAGMPVGDFLMGYLRWEELPWIWPTSFHELGLGINEKARIRWAPASMHSFSPLLLTVDVCDQLLQGLLPWVAAMMPWNLGSAKGSLYLL